MSSSKKNLSYQQLKKNRWFLVALTLGLVILVVAIFIELIQSQRTSQVDPKLKKYAIALSPTFNEAVFNKLDTLTYLSPQQVREEVSSLPLRIIDRETKQIVILEQGDTATASQAARTQLNSNKPSTESAQPIETSNQENEGSTTP
jgi:hypothetical protein